MKKQLLAVALSALAAAASAHDITYTVTTTWFEPDTQPKNTVFQGTLVWDEHSNSAVSLTGTLSESMTGTSPADYTLLTLNNLLVTSYDATLGGTFLGVFKNTTTSTFMGGTWTPEDGIAWGGVYAGFPRAGNNPGNAYAYIFVPDVPTAPLTAAQLAKLAYADCAPGGMMGAVCMTGTSEAGYGSVGTMSGYPISQTITAAVPEPESYLLMLAGLGAVGALVRRRKSRA